MGETPFNLCFGIEAIIPAQIGSKFLRNIAWNEASNDQMLYENLPLVMKFERKIRKEMPIIRNRWANIIMQSSNLNN